MSIGDVAAELQRAADSLPVADVRAAVDTAEQGLAELVATAHGSRNGELWDAIDRVKAFHASCVEWLRALQQARNLILAYRAHLLAPAPVPTAEPIPPKPAAPVPSPRFDPDVVTRILADLPPEPETPNRSGRKANGVWYDPEGSSDRLSSGWDVDADAADVLLLELFSNPLSIAAHVEVKVVMRMRATGTRRVTLLVNKQPCSGPLGCNRLLPTILPAGYELTVYGPRGFVKTYVGGKK